MTWKVQSRHGEICILPAAGGQIEKMCFNFRKFFLHLGKHPETVGTVSKMQFCSFVPHSKTKLYSLPIFAYVYQPPTLMSLLFLTIKVLTLNHTVVLATDVVLEFEFATRAEQHLNMVDVQSWLASPEMVLLHGIHQHSLKLTWLC